MTRAGRPRKYTALLAELQRETLYTPAKIADFAIRQGYLDTIDPNTVHLARQRIRICMGRFASNHHFPENGDGMVKLAGQAPCPAWFGWRWQSANSDEKS